MEIATHEQYVPDVHLLLQREGGHEFRPAFSPNFPEIGHAHLLARAVRKAADDSNAIASITIYFVPGRHERSNVLHVDIGIGVSTPQRRNPVYDHCDYHAGELPPLSRSARGQQAANGTRL